MLDTPIPVSDRERPLEGERVANLGAWFAPVVALCLGFVLLTDTAFWAGVLFLISGALFSRLRARWVPAVLAAFYMGHYQLVQDTLGDPGPFVMRNWMALGFAAGVIITGYGLSDAVRRRSLDSATQWYTGAVLVLVLLSVLTVTDRSFLADDSPGEYVRLWLVTASATAALAVISGVAQQAFLAACLILGYVNMVFLPNYVGTALGTSWSITTSAAVLSALILFRRRVWLAAVLVLPLIVGLALAGKEGPQLGTMVGVIAWFVMNGCDSRRQRLRLYWVLGGGICLAAAVSALQLWGVISARVLAAGLDVRLSLYEEAWSRLRASPLIGEWVLSPAIPGPIEFFPGVSHELLAYPHSSILEVLISWGIVGLGVWLTAQIVAVPLTWITGLFPLWLAGLVFAQSSGDLTSNYTYWFAGAIAVSAAAANCGRSALKPPGGSASPD